MKMLVVEDEPRISNIIHRALGEAGYEVDTVASGLDALDKFELQPYDLVMLDLRIPDPPGGGIEVCRRIRLASTSVPIIMLTAMDSSASKVQGLDAGADDYLVKPFNLDELLARVRALLRRGHKADPPVLQIADLSLDPATRTARRAGRDIRLTSKEYAILEYLMRHPGRVINQTELLDHVWDYEYSGMSNVVEVYIGYLRRKIRSSGEAQLIHTLRGQGYILRVPNA